jgi:hypothetical protein
LSKTQESIIKLKKLFGNKERHIVKTGIVKFGTSPYCDVVLPASVYDEESINFKILYSYYKGFFIKCFGKTSRTSFKVTKLPFYLDLNMVIQVGKNVFLAVEKINPLSKHPEETTDGILLDTHKHKIISSIYGLEETMKSIDGYKDKLKEL